jgi:hypothetical protein
VFLSIVLNNLLASALNCWSKGVRYNNCTIQEKDEMQLEL